LNAESAQQLLIINHKPCCLSIQRRAHATGFVLQYLSARNQNQINLVWMQADEAAQNYSTPSHQRNITGTMGTTQSPSNSLPKQLQPQIA
jgi:hypothetical protein